MDKYRQIGELIKAFQRSGQSFFPATIESVEGLTCTIKVDNLSISDVRLKATNDDTEDTILLTPAVGSNVLVGSMSGTFDNLFIVHSDSISEAYLKVGETTFKLDKNGVEINGGKNDGVVKIKDMVSWMTKVYNDLQSLSTQLSTHLVAGNGAALGMSFNVTTPNPSKADFEDTKVKH